MKTEVLLRSIGKINDELIADAESEAKTKRKPGWAKLGIMAACLALVLCTGIATHAIRSNATAGTFTMDVNPSVKVPAVALLRMAFAAMPVQRTSARQAAMIPSLTQPGFLLVFASLSASAMSSSLIFPIERRRTSVFIA